MSPEHAASEHRDGRHWFKADAERRRAHPEKDASAGGAEHGELTTRPAWSTDPASGEPGMPDGVRGSLSAVVGESGVRLGPASVRRIESSLGTGIPAVQVHEGPAAQELARLSNARAFAFGNHIGFAAGAFRPGTVEGDHLIAHEVAHVVQTAGGQGPSSRGALESEAGRVAGALTSGSPVRVSAQSAPRLLLNDEDEPNPIADWVNAPNSFLVIQSDNRLFLVPGSGLLKVPPTVAGQAASTPVRITTDAGALFGVPAAGASGARVFRAGPRSAIMLDAGSGTGAGAVFLDQLQGVMANLGVSRITKLMPIHAHQDHVNEIVNVANRLQLPPEAIVIPSQYVNATGPMRRVEAGLRARFGPTWQPGRVLADRGTLGSDVFRSSFSVGELRVELVALRSSLARVTSANADQASFLTKVTRSTDGASVVILGDMHGRHLEPLRLAMEAERTGGFQEFFRGVNTLSGFSHHAGALTNADVPGLMAVLDATLLQSGTLRIVEQTSLRDSRLQNTRASTLQLLEHLGVEVAMTDLPANLAPAPAGGAPNPTSGAEASGTTVSVRGPDARLRPRAQSPLVTSGIRLDELVKAGKTIDTWRPWLEEINNAEGRRFLDGLRAEIETSATTLRGQMRTSVEAALRARAGPPGDVDLGNRFQQSLTALGGTTNAERLIKAEGFAELARLRSLPDSEIPRRVLIHDALVNGRYSPQAFQAMYAALDPSTRTGCFEVLAAAGLSRRRSRSDASVPPSGSSKAC